MPLLAYAKNTVLPIFSLNSRHSESILFSSHLKSILLVIQGSTTTSIFYKNLITYLRNSCSLDFISATCGGADEIT